MVDSALVKRSRVRDEEKWEPVFHPHPLKISGIYHVHDFGWIQPEIIMIYGQWKEQVLLHSFPGTHFLALTSLTLTSLLTLTPVEFLGDNPARRAPSWER